METTRLVSDIEQQEVDVSERKGVKFYLVWFWRFCIFGLVGSSSVKVTRLLLSRLASK